LKTPYTFSACGMQEDRRRSKNFPFFVSPLLTQADLSRFGRDYLEVGNYISRIFPFLGVRFIAVNDGFDSIRLSDVDSFETSFKTLIYDLYSRDLSRKVRKAKAFRAQRGEFLSPFAPFGFAKDPEMKNHLVIDPPAAEIVRRIFLLAGNGQTTTQIAKTLNLEAVPTPMLYKRMAGCARTVWSCVHEDNFWMNWTVSKILRDERYIGKNIYGKRTRDKIGCVHTVKVGRENWISVTNTHEGIVSKEEFDRAQATMRDFAEYEGRPFSAGRGKLRCGICGHAMTRSNSKITFYYCKTPLVTDVCDCNEVHILERDIEELLLDGIRTQAAIAIEMSRIWEERHNKVRASTAATVKTLTALKETHTRLEQGIKALYESFALGDISKAEYVTQKAAAVRDRDTTAIQIAKMEASLDNPGRNDSLNNRFVDCFKQYAEIRELTSQTVDEVLETVYLYPGERLEIVWNYQDDLQKLMLDLENI